MGWGLRRSKNFGLFKLNLSKSGIGFSFGVPGARIGVNSKGKKYVRGGIPGTGLFYQSSLPDAQQFESPERTREANSVSPVFVLIVLLVAVVVFLAVLSSTVKTAVPVLPVQRTIAPVAAPAPLNHPKKKRKIKRSVHSAQAASAGTSNQ